MAIQRSDTSVRRRVRPNADPTFLSVSRETAGPADDPGDRGAASWWRPVWLLVGRGLAGWTMLIVS